MMKRVAKDALPASDHEQRRLAQYLLDTSIDTRGRVHIAW